MTGNYALERGADRRKNKQELTHMAKPKVPRNLQDADQILIWKAAVALMDRRGIWPRAMTRAIQMIEARDPALKYQYRDVKRLYERH